jgi:hypothetical protein
MNQMAFSLDPDVKHVVQQFEARSGLQGVDYDVKPRPDGHALIFRLANPTERFYKLLQEINPTISAENGPAIISTVQKRTPTNRLQSPEGRYFLRILSESLNINRGSFKDDFFARYTKSVSNAEAQITAAANHIVFGRRGAGKSSLLLYAMRMRERETQPSVWLDMQVYQKRADNRLALDVFSDILRQLTDFPSRVPVSSHITAKLESLRAQPDLDDDEIRRFLPEMRQAFIPLQTGPNNLFVFLDDFHVLDTEAQAKLLGFIYSVTRGTNVFLKLSAIETLTKTWDSVNHTGLQVPHDAQTIKLDYNLTMPDKAAAHIEGILDAHAAYCGLPSVRFLCTSNDVLSRLIWVSAGVPRDALNMFAQAMTKGSISNRTRVSVTNVNLAASEMVSQKMRDLEIDVPTSPQEHSLSAVLEQVKNFCIRQERKNAFLVEIQNDVPVYQSILKLVDLRLVHVISEGITVGEAGRKFLGLILDYGFYTGIRAAQSVDLFNKQTERVTYKELRKLPIFDV